jgi:predicted transcriptional regulator
MNLDPRAPFLNKFISVNIFILLFNMLPAFPMDGGRVLRALLASRMPYAQATRIAATIGQSMAILFGFVGFAVFQPLLIFIAIFVWIGASQESNIADIRSGLEGIRVRDAMITEFQSLNLQDNLGHAIDAILAGSQHDFPVMDDDAFAGLLTRKDLMVALAQHGKGKPVAEVIRKDMEKLDSSDLMTEVLPKIQASAYQTLPVFDRGHLSGLLTSENIGELLMIRSALGDR